ncbi:MAG TPA: DUF885 family protein [Steroidobacteraceae bacterium]|jgi:hypothetical protein
MKTFLYGMTVAASLAGAMVPGVSAAAGDYDKLVSLSNEWRQFAKPTIANCVPDYSVAAMAKKATELKGYQSRLDAIKIDGWPEAQQIDYKLFKAELNGMDFDLRVLKPWARDPTFYASVWSEQSDVPEHEGPSSEPIINLYEFSYPLSAADQKKLTCMLGAVPTILENAKGSLQDSTARDLWVYGTRAFREQSKTLSALEAGTLHLRTLAGDIPASLKGADKTVVSAVQKAREATDAFQKWLDTEAPSKKGPSGVGKENYDWYMKNVHLVPYTWEQQATLLRRELERSRASLALEEFRNRKLPQLEPVANPAAYQAMADAKMNKIVNFLIDGGIVPDKPYYRDAMQQKKGGYTSLQQDAGFFAHTTMRNPLGIYSHNYHWIELARIKNEPNPSPIRSLTPVFDMYDSRSEGLATAVEEMLMHAGMYDDDPRGREIVWIMAANRAARGLASLYVQSNDITMAEGGAFHARWTPRKWSDPASDLVKFEQLLYLRQPGYGTSYITGKILLDRLISDYSAQVEDEGKAFDLGDFFKHFNAAGIMPYPLIEEEMVKSPAHIGVPVATKASK